MVLYVYIGFGFGRVEMFKRMLKGLLHAITGFPVPLNIIALCQIHRFENLVRNSKQGVIHVGLWRQKLC